MFAKYKFSQSVIITCLSLCVNHSVCAEQKSNCLPFLSGLPDQTQMIAPSSMLDATKKAYILPATPATTQFGFYDNSQAPVLTIKSGESVMIETMAASDNQVVPGTTIEQIMQVQNAVPGRGPHTVTGPIYIEGAEPGDVLRIHINRIVPRPYASNNTGHGKGLFPKEFPDVYVKYFYLDFQKKQMQFAPGILVPLAPFPGIMAVAQAEPGKFSTSPPGRFGGNMDLRELVEGTTLYLPVFVKGALFWTGDSHAGQGNGEIDLTAIETAFEELNVTFDVIKKKSLIWPRVETSTAWITVGYDADLNKALDILKSETIKFMMEEHKLTQAQAEKKMLETWNCPIAEVVNGIKGVYCILPKQAAIKSVALPKTDNAKFFVTYAKDADVEKAMSTASMAMINKIVAAKKLSRVDAYTLASFTMDCRIGPHKVGDKEVHCMMAKSLWV